VNGQQDPFIGKVIDGRYEIQARIGEGGMGVVYKARQVSIDRVIALKMLNAQMAADPNWVQRFYNEAKACSRLQHPNTIRMFDFGQSSEGRLFMTMEFLDGLVLREALAKQSPFAATRVMKILIQCCASLAEAHAIGIIHRDIKPDNVFLLNMAGSPDFVKLLDFSVAKLLQEGDRMKTQAGVVFGTPQYMSPEQGRGMPLDARSDLYALGILAYEMLVGRVPFNDDNPMNVLQMHLRTEIPPLPQTIPMSAQNVVRRALEKDPSRRYQSAGEMMQHCQQVFSELNQGGVSVGGGGVPKTMIAQSPLANMQQGQPMQGPGGGPPPGFGQPPPGFGPPPAQGGYGQQPPPGFGQPPPGFGQPPPGFGQPQGQGGYGQQPPPGFGPPGQQGPGGYQAAQPAQKTMFAGQAVGTPGGPQLPGGGPPPGFGAPPGAPQGFGQQPGQGGYVHAQPQQKTMMANAAQMGITVPQAGGPPPGAPPSGPPPGFGPAPGAPGGSPKTVMLQSSEGVLSVGQTGGTVPAATSADTGGGASTAFWIVSMLMGIGLGAAAYAIYLQTL
jgi:serine/threonine-protein kinase